MITFYTSRYEQIHKKRPQGLGRWHFQIGFVTYTYECMYRQARNLARRAAKIAGESVIEVQP
jgi:hypothetical protein